MFVYNTSTERNDCFRTSLSCLLGVRPEELPNWFESFDKDIEYRDINRSLKPFGYCIVAKDWDCGLETVLEQMEEAYGSDYIYLLSGRTLELSPHCFIYKGKTLLHDVSGSGTTRPLPLGIQEVKFQTTHLGVYVKS